MGQLDTRQITRAAVTATLDSKEKTQGAFVACSVEPDLLGELQEGFLKEVTHELSPEQCVLTGKGQREVGETILRRTSSYKGLVAF